MMKKPFKLDFHWTSMVALVVAVAAWRAFAVDSSSSLIANFTPVGAIALFAGAHFRNRIVRYLFPLGILLLSDLFLSSQGTGSNGLYAGWFWVYLAFAITIYFGQKISSKICFFTVSSVSIGSAVVHWLLSDFGFWLAGGINVITGAPYEKTVEGLFFCFGLGFPFFIKLAASTLLYSLMMFGAYSYITKLAPREIALWRSNS